KNNSVYQNFINYICNNPGTANSYCSNQTTEILKNTCSQNEICINGECKSIKCYQNSDCGTDGPLGDKYCINNDSYQDYIKFKCNNPGTHQASCSNTTLPVKLKICDLACIHGECINCFSNLDCGINGYVGEKYCVNKSVYQNYKEFYCKNPGTPDSICMSDTKPKLIEECEDMCINGKCVKIKCYKDSDCDDNNLNTIDKCINPGTPQSYCTNTPVNCINDADCGITGFIGEEYCFNNDVYKNFRISICKNPGTVNSYCELSLIPKLIVDCIGQCINGTCIQQQYACYKNSDCGNDGFIGDLFCIGNDVYQQYKTYTCLNPGTSQASCTSSISNVFKQHCAHQCLNGQCLDITCYKNSDCGTDGFIGSGFCFQNDLFKNFITFKCNNPGTSQSYCTNSSSPQLFLDCGDSYCLNFGQNYCKNGDVYKSRTCHDKGCSNNNCFDNTYNDEVLVKKCDYGCSNGECINITIKCYKDSDCNDNNVYTIDKCINPGTPQSYCTNTPVNCINDADCGITGFIGNETCLFNDVYKNYQISECKNPGTTNSYCLITLTQKLINDCGENSCTNYGNNYCKNNNVYKSRTCTNRGCSNAACFENSYLDETLVQICPPGQICSNGQCLDITCYKNSDCGNDGFIGDLFCINNSIYQNFITYTCNNPGTAGAFCSNSSKPKLKQICPPGQVCSNGQCINIRCYQNSDCGTDGPVGDPYCIGNNLYRKIVTYTCNNPGTINSSCSNFTSESLIKDCTTLTAQQTITQVFGNPDVSQWDPAYNDIVGYCADPATANAYCIKQGFLGYTTYGSRWLGPRLDNDKLYVWNGASYNVVDGFKCSYVLSPVTCYKTTTANGICSNGQCKNPVCSQSIKTFGNPDVSQWDPAYNDIVGYCANPLTATQYCKSQGYEGYLTYNQRWLGPRLDNDKLYVWNGASYNVVDGFKCSYVLSPVTCYKNNC
ncbi:MAG: hypothetical protein QXW97_03375, partial [Candidatus Pacearchaeota archaeon]